MSLRTGMNAPAVLIDKYINSSYDTVKEVANNLTSVVAVGDFLLDPETAGDIALLADNITGSVDSALGSAVAAASSAVEAEASAVLAESYSTAGGLSAAAAAVSALNLATAVQEAEDWAYKTSATVDGSEWSSKHYAEASSASAITAAAQAALAAGYAAVGFDLASAVYDFGFISDAQAAYTTDYGTVI